MVSLGGEDKTIIVWKYDHPKVIKQMGVGAEDDS